MAFWALLIDDHGAVVEIADALALVLAFAHDAQGEDFAGEDDGLEGVGQFVEVDVGDGLEFGHFAQVVVVGVELGAQGAGEADELGVDFGFLREIGLVDFEFVAFVLAQAGEHLQAAASAGADDGVVGIGDFLQFVEDESGDDERALDEIGFEKVGDAAVNNNAGVEEEEVFGLGLGGEADVGDDEGEILLVAAHGQDHAEVAETQEQGRDG